MEYYAGFDIGTTNLKCLLLSGEGNIVKTLREVTPKIIEKGHRFFDLGKIEEFVDSTIELLSSSFDLKSVSFSTVGETVVPVRNGRALCNPPLWDEAEITSTPEEREIIEALAPPSVIGTLTKPLFSIHKILWMKREIPGVKDADTFLPLSTYLIWRKTGRDNWDYSQASRSGAFNIRNKCWIETLLDRFNIRLSSTVKPIGSEMGENNGIVYALGGHDHIIGFYGIEKTFPHYGKELYYSSMGTSEVLASLVREENTYSFIPSSKGYLQPSFFPGYYTATRSFRNFGSMLKLVRDFTDYRDDYETITRDLSKLKSTMPACLFTSDGDFIISDSDRTFLNMLDIRKGASRAEIVESAYLYLSVVSELMRDDLEKKYSLSRDGLFIVGGGITGNSLFMRYLSASISLPVYMLETEEISALGAALSGANAYGRKAFEIRHILIAKDEEKSELIENTKNRYRELIRR